MNSVLNKTKPLMILSGSLVLMALYAAVLQYIPVADMTQQFGVPTALSGTVASLISNGSTAIAVIGVLGGFMSGGLGLIANAGRAALMKYLKDELEKRGRKAFIAW